MLKEIINDSYERFVDIIEEGRGMTEAEVKAVADGRIMNGRQAIEAGLADGVGKVGDVIAAMKEDFDLQDAIVFEYAAEESWTTMLGVKAGSLVGSNIETELIGKLLSDYNAPRMMYLYGER
jgi:protease-4